MERLIDANALTELANNSADGRIDANDIARFPSVDPARVCVLPCKVGGYYWKVTQTRTVDGKPRPLHVRGMRLSWENVGKVAQEYGKTAFSTHAEAKAALKRAMAEWLKEQEEVR